MFAMYSLTQSKPWIEKNHGASCSCLNGPWLPIALFSCWNSLRPVICSTVPTCGGLIPPSKWTSKSSSCRRVGNSWMGSTGWHFFPHLQGRSFITLDFTTTSGEVTKPADERWQNLALDALKPPLAGGKITGISTGVVCVCVQIYHHLFIFLYLPMHP